MSWINSNWWQTSISVKQPYTAEHISKFQSEGKTIAEVLRAKFDLEIADKNNATVNKIEQSYNKCLNLIKLQALNTLNQNSQNVYWGKIWMFYWWGFYKHNTLSDLVSEEQINTMYELGKLVNEQFKNWKNKQLAEDLDKEWLVMRFSYNNGYMKESWGFNVSLQALDTMPEYKHDNPLNIWISLHHSLR